MKNNPFTTHQPALLSAQARQQHAQAFFDNAARRLTALISMGETRCNLTQDCQRSLDKTPAAQDFVQALSQHGFKHVWRWREVSSDMAKELYGMRAFF